MRSDVSTSSSEKSPEFSSLRKAIPRTLAYYDIWQYPLSRRELFRFLPVNSLSFNAFVEYLETSGPGPSVSEHDGFYFLSSRDASVVSQRREREGNARNLWRIARISMHCIKRFPFVRGVFVSGDLSKNATHPDSDVDFFVITATGRLWIARSLLILFKKLFLLNRKKYFCLNSFVTERQLLLNEKNIFIATEIAHLKPLFNDRLFHKYLAANVWIREFFPNFEYEDLPSVKTNNQRSMLQWLLELPFRIIPADRIDRYIMRKMRGLWSRRYPDFDAETRERIFRSTRDESRAYVGNFQDRILEIYNQKLREL